MAEPATAFEPTDPEAEEHALLAGEAQLDAGQSIPLADVVRWLDSWGTPELTVLGTPSPSQPAAGPLPLPRSG